MAITYTWTITKLECYSKVDGQTDVVWNAYWTLTGTDGTYTGSTSDYVSFVYVAGSPFTPYADLTEAQVIGWVQTAMGEEQIAIHQAKVDKQIADQIDPPVVTPALPWA